MQLGRQYANEVAKWEGDLWRAVSQNARRLATLVSPDRRPMPFSPGRQGRQRQMDGSGYSAGYRGIPATLAGCEAASRAGITRQRRAGQVHRRRADDPTSSRTRKPTPGRCANSPPSWGVRSGLSRKRPLGSNFRYPAKQPGRSGRKRHTTGTLIAAVHCEQNRAKSEHLKKIRQSEKGRILRE